MYDFPVISGATVCIDTETNGLDWTDPDIGVFGISLSILGGGDFYWDIRQTPAVVPWLADKANEAGKVVNHNIKFDMHMLRKLGIHIDPIKAECTQVRAALIDEHLRSYSLDSLLGKYLGKSKYNDIYEQLAKLFGGKPTRSQQMPNLHRAPASMVSRYAIDDSRGALELWEWQEQEIARQGLDRVWDLERRLFKVVYKAEMRGIAVDIEAAERAAEQISVKVDKMRAELNNIAGFEVNPNPSGSIKQLFKPKQLPDGSWVAIDGTPLPSTDSGAASLGRAALEAMTHPAADLILRTRKLIKARDTFIKGHIIGHARNGRVYPNINQTKGDSDAGGTMGTGTGRLSYTNPALQQIPARDVETASIIRPLFLPNPGQRWSYGDLDQHEYRIFAHYVNNPDIIKAYQENPDLDFHQRVADLTGLPRSAPKAGGPNAKQLNLGMVFCMGAGHMAEMCNLPWEWDTFVARGETIRFQKAGPEGEALVEEYHQNIPGIREMAAKAKRVAMSRGYIRTLRGRHIRFPNKGSARKASGLAYQGGAGDLNKENMILIDEYIESECPQNSLLLNIHDEYSVSLEQDGKEVRHLKEMQRLIQDKPDMRVPIRIDFGMPSENWWEATNADKAT